MTLTDKFRLPLIETNQAQKHITHNEAVLGVDALMHLRLESLSQDTPPTSPVIGNAWFVGQSPSDDWLEHAGEIAFFDQFGWHYFIPVEGMIAWHSANAELVIFDGTSWMPTGTSGTGTQNIDMLGIATTADSYNKLAVKSESAWFSHTDSGADVRLKLNKSAEAATASFIFQTAWSGRAEIGLVGDDHFQFKVSADGAAWKTSIECDATTGEANFPNGIGMQVSGLANKINLIPNSGRLAAEPGTAVVGFSFPSSINAENGGTIAAHQKFHTDSVDYGGNNNANAPDVKQLVDGLKMASAARNFPEFWVAKVNAGTGTNFENTASGNSKYRVLSLDLVLGTAASFSGYIKVHSGSIVISGVNHSVWVDEQNISDFIELTAADGWKHINVITNSSKNLSSNFYPNLLPVFANHGDEFLLALPAIMPDTARVSMSEGLVLSLG